jgi:hypothetical protein
MFSPLLPFVADLEDTREVGHQNIAGCAEGAENWQSCIDVSCAEMEFLDINLTKKGLELHAITVPSTGGFKETIHYSGF